MAQLPIAYEDADGQRLRGALGSLPDRCPSCKNGIKPIYLSARRTDRDFTRRKLIVSFQCPIEKCLSVFLAQYSTIHPTDEVFLLNGCVFSEYLAAIDVPKTVQEISPRFRKSYFQSMIAEANGLDEVCGPGFRKSLEILVTDFLVRGVDQVERDRILNLTLGNRIQEIDDPRIRRVASRAAWLGNDQTHFLRKWEEKDIGDLRALISLTMNAIDSHELTKHYEDSMPRQTGSPEP